MNDPGKDQQIAQLSEAALGKLDGGLTEARTTIDAEERIGALTDYIRFRVTEQLMVKLRLRRLSQAVADISLHPHLVRSEAMRRKGPLIRLTEASLLTLLDRLAKQQKAIGLSKGFSRLVEAAASSRIKLSEGLELERRVQSFVARLKMAESYLVAKKKAHLQKAFSKVAQQGISGIWRMCLQERAADGLLKLLAVSCRSMVYRRQAWLFSSLKTNVIVQEKAKINDLNRALSSQKAATERARQELASSETGAMTLKAEINKVRSASATSSLELQKSQAKARVLETENTSLISRYDDLSFKFQQATEDRDRLADTVDSLRQEYYSLQQDYDTRIDNYTKATEEVSEAAAKTSMERAALADKLKAMVQQREEDRQWFVKVESEKQEIALRIGQQEMANKSLAKQNGELKEKLSETMKSLVLMKDEHLRLRKESEDRTSIIEKLNKDVLLGDLEIRNDG